MLVVELGTDGMRVGLEGEGRGRDLVRILLCGLGER